MSLTINTNIASLQSQNAITNNSSALQTSMEQLSTGMRINSAKDGAAGLAIADGMTEQINGMTVSTQNANNAISMTQTADGAMGSVADSLQTMRELALQAANTGATTTSDNQKLQIEFKQLGNEIQRIVSNTTFNGIAVLSGGLSGANFQVGAGTTTANRISVTVPNLNKISGLSALFGNQLSIGSGLGTNSTAFTSVIKFITTAVTNIENSRAILGAVQNRLQLTVTNLGQSIVNQSSARATIMDTNYAQASANLAREQIIQQAATAMLAQANQSGNSVMTLLR
jgi:flagellin